MHKSDDLPVALARLVALGQSPDVNIRPVLLRVVVDLFTSKPHHAPSDLQQFSAIVAHLLEEADADTRIIVAEKLAKHPATPRDLLERLAAQQTAIAAMVYAHAALDDATLLAAASWGAEAIAAVLASRDDLPATVVAALADRPEAGVLHALAANAGVTFDRPTFQHLVRRARQDRDLAARLIDREADAIDLAPLFPLVPSAQRQVIVDAARRLDLGRRQWGRIDGATAETLARLDRLVLRGERDAFEMGLGDALGLDTRALTALLHDDSGEILALALAAAGASPDMAARAFILGDPRIGRSVDKVRSLTAIVANLSQHAARRLINAMTSDSAETHRRPATAGTVAPAPRRHEGVVSEPVIRRETPVPVRRLG